MTEIYARYRGNGEFYPGVPARSLSREEYEALSAEEQALVSDGRIYEIKGNKPVQEVNDGR